MKLKNNELGKIRVLINRMRLKNQLEEVLENHTSLNAFVFPCIFKNTYVNSFLRIEQKLF